MMRKHEWAATRLEVGKTYTNRLGQRFYVMGISADDQVTIKHVNTGCTSRLPRPLLTKELREEAPAPLFDRAAGWALAVIVCLLVVGAVVA